MDTEQARLKTFHMYGMSDCHALVEGSAVKVVFAS